MCKYMYVIHVCVLPYVHKTGAIDSIRLAIFSGFPSAEDALKRTSSDYMYVYTHDKIQTLRKAKQHNTTQNILKAIIFKVNELSLEGYELMTLYILGRCSTTELLRAAQLDHTYN